jgi:hypothetical protein
MGKIYHIWAEKRGRCKAHPNENGTQTFAMTKVNNTYIVGQ